MELRTSVTTSAKAPNTSDHELARGFTKMATAITSLQGVGVASAITSLQGALSGWRLQLLAEAPPK